MTPDEMLELLRKMRGEELRRDYIPYFKLITRVRLLEPEMEQEEISKCLAELKRRGRVRILDNFNIYVVR